MKHTINAGPPLLNPDDVDFLLFEWLDVEALCRRERSRETFDAVLDLAAEIAVKDFSPHHKIADVDEPSRTETGEVDTRPEIKQARAAAG